MMNAKMFEPEQCLSNVVLQRVYIPKGGNDILRIETVDGDITFYLSIEPKDNWADTELIDGLEDLQSLVGQKLVKNKPAKKSHSSITTGVGSGNIKPYEDIGFRYPSNILKFNRVPRGKNKHPTQKPVDLLEWLIKTYSNSEDVVLDFTMGSGSTGVAAKRLNRSFIGIELNKEFFDIAKDRIDNDTF